MYKKRYEKREKNETYIHSQYSFGAHETTMPAVAWVVELEDVVSQAPTQSIASSYKSIMSVTKLDYT